MNVESVHDLIIILHGIVATMSFFAGCFLLFSIRQTSRKGMFGVSWWALTGLAVLLAGAILVYWTRYSTVERLIFPALFALSIFMIYRASSARRLLQRQQDNWRHEYIEHIGFTLISLFEGFMIVSGLNSGLPGWLVGLLAILGVLLGRWVIHFAQRRLASNVV